MIVEKIRLKNYQVHADTTLVLPPTGITLITGASGAGKSSILDAVSVACWGKTLRGETPWEEGKASSVEIVLPGVRLIRSRSESNKTHLHAWMNGVEVAKAATTTKAQESVAGAFTTFEVWRRTSALSAADAAHFSLASPSERGRLLEEVLGLDKFDKALASVLEDLRPLEAEKPRKAGDRARLEALKRGKKEVLDALIEPPPPDELLEAQTAYVAADAAWRQTQAALDTIYNSMRELGARVAHQRGELSEVSGRLNTLSGPAECPTCGGVVTGALLAILRGSSSQARADLESAERVYAEEGLREQEARTADALAFKRRLGAEARLRELQTQERHAATQRFLREEAQEAIREANEDLLNLFEEESDLVGRINVLLAAKQVLQPSGVRARLLSGALDGVETVANGWLDRMGADVHVRLRPFTERADGSVKDAVTLELGGVPPNPSLWKPYGACSGGQRRRADVALVMALGEVAAAALGRKNGTLWLDEVGDHLDAAGVAGFCEALRDESERRCVVVITHNDRLVRALGPDAHYHVTAGVLARVI